MLTEVLILASINGLKKVMVIFFAAIHRLEKNGEMEGAFFEKKIREPPENPRCAIAPEPACFLRSFGDSSVNFTLHFWVEDVTLGRWPTQSEVMFSIWRKFKDNSIEIPFPQRDLHIKGPLSFNGSGEATPSKEG